MPCRLTGSEGYLHIPRRIAEEVPVVLSQESFNVSAPVAQPEEGAMAGIAYRIVRPGQDDVA